MSPQGTDSDQLAAALETIGRLEERLGEAQKMEAVGLLAGGIAHDFNNLLTVINGYSRLLLGKLGADDPSREILEEIHRAGERAAGLTQQLLAFIRKHSVERTAVDLNGLLQGMRPMLSRLLGEDLELAVHLNPETPAVCADAHQLEQVLMNLAVNSRDAMPYGGKLLIETDSAEWRAENPESAGMRPGQYAVLAVSDNGSGMSEETRRRIFEPFFTTKPKGKGTGLGLSMVHSIVAQHGGRVDVQSVPSHGTTFRIYLPVAQDTPCGQGKTESGQAIAGQGTVLVVEDQLDVRKYAAAALEAYGYRVIQAESAADALLLCGRSSERIDLALIDVVMPHLNGRQLSERLTKRWPEIRILFMSGYSDDAVLRDGILQGGAEFIQKPFSPNQLAVRVGEMLSQPTSARILIADDEDGVRSFLREVLQDGGYEVVEASDGKRALEEVRNGRVDLVLTDLVMPGTEGIETIQALRKEVPRTGIIAMSGAFDGQLLKTARMLGADSSLGKPVNPALLLARVAEVLKRRR